MYADDDGDLGDIIGVIAGAANMGRYQDNPTYADSDFLTMYPQFTNVPDTVRAAWIKIADATLQYGRYQDMWEVLMGLFVAHYLTLYLQSAADANAPAKNIVQSGLAKGLLTSKSADGLSAGYDFSMFANDFQGWGTYGLTLYGQQFVTMAKMSFLPVFAVR